MDSVKIWEEEVLIPTYDIGASDKNPMFLEKRVYQGSSGKIYPYPATQTISREKKNKKWKAVFLENEYLKVMVLPELGGRIQRAYDKTNGYDFVYYNKVIKPALVGLTGPWISGGIEFNWPQHHRPTTYMKVDHRIVENRDGSKSLLLGDVDRMYGTRVITSITLYSGKASKAKEMLLEALSYPENLGEGKLEGTKDNNLYYLLALAAKELGDDRLYKDSLNKAVLGTSEPAGVMYYYDQPADMILFQGLAYEELGKKAEANRRFYKLIDYGEQHIRDEFVMDYFAVSMPDMSVFDADMNKKNQAFCYYVMGLGNLGLGKKDEAGKWFDKALQIESTHQLSRFYR